MRADAPGGEILVYEAEDGGVRVDVRLDRDTVWLSQEQMGRLFGHEREEGLAALLGNLDQTVFGAPAYPTVESKAAHLLFSMPHSASFATGGS